MYLKADLCHLMLVLGVLVLVVSAPEVLALVLWYPAVLLQVILDLLFLHQECLQSDLQSDLKESLGTVS
jgi:hypothetical protein